MRIWILIGAAVAAALVTASPLVAQERGAERDRIRAESDRIRAQDLTAVRGAASVRQGWIGLAFDYQREERRGGVRERAVVTDVRPGSPAARAQIQRGDVIVRVNGREDVESQVRALRLQPGDTVRMRIQRAGQRDRDIALVADRRPDAAVTGLRGAADRRVEVRRLAPGSGIVIVNGDTVRIPVDSLLMHADSIHNHIRVLIADSLGPRLRALERVYVPAMREGIRSLDSTFVRAFPDGFAFEVGRRAVAGAEFTELNAELAQYFDGAREGLLVTRVAPESPASRAGLAGGDVVVRANGRTVRTTAELRRAVADAGRDEVRLDVVRRGRTVTLRLR
jgi:S1-C subfamily serine protease